jgi:hypothetical protein
VANANEAPRQCMQQKTPQELVGADGHPFLFITPGVVFPPKRDLAVLKRDQAVVGDGHSMRIPGEVVQDVLGSAEGSFHIDDPILPEKLAQETVEQPGVVEVAEYTVESQVVLAEKALQPRNELAPQYLAKDANRKKEPGGCADPVRAIRGDAARRNNAVDVWVMPPSSTIP